MVNVFSSSLVLSSLNWWMGGHLDFNANRVHTWSMSQLRQIHTSASQGISINSSAGLYKWKHVSAVRLPV